MADGCIAIVGSHPETFQLAPYHLKDWSIWAFSRRNYKALPRYDAWFELHKGIKEMPGYMESVAANPKAVTYHTFPWNDLIDEFGPYFFSSGQIPWIMAYAITRKPKTIGIWGIEGAPPKYGEQRQEIWHFASIAKQRGIEVIAPTETKLLDPYPYYAFS